MTNEEKKLVVQIQTGSREAFERLLDLYESRVYGLVCRMVGSGEAEDVAQEALVEIYRSIGGFRGKSGLGTWVYRVAVNVCLEHRRRRRPETASLDEDQQGVGVNDPCDHLQRSAVRGEVGAAIDALPDIHRDVVVLHELQGLTYQECAEVLGCPVGTVKSRLSHAFGKLRELLKSYASEGEVAI